MKKLIKPLIPQFALNLYRKYYSLKVLMSSPMEIPTKGSDVQELAGLELQEIETLFENYKFPSSQNIKQDIQKNYAYNGDLLEYFAENKNEVVFKWHHYIPLYDRYFSPYRGKKIRFLEIGVDHGGSLKMWRKYFGEDAIIYGIDINPYCEKFNGQAGQVRIGSQDDRNFLEQVITEMGGVDIVLDDGSHHMQHIPVTLNYLFPKLNLGGIYMIEDLHTAYWRPYGGGYEIKENFFKIIPNIVDSMHRWYHKKNSSSLAIIDSCTGIHIHDSITVFEKNIMHKPTHSRVK